MAAQVALRRQQHQEEILGLAPVTMAFETNQVTKNRDEISKALNESRKPETPSSSDSATLDDVSSGKLIIYFVILFDCFNIKKYMVISNVCFQLNFIFKLFLFNSSLFLYLKLFLFWTS